MHPLIVTLTIDEAEQRRFDEQRRTYFPTGRTVIGAHVTLFHALPGELEQDVRETLDELAGHDAFDVRVAELMSLGGGVAYRLTSTDLDEVHATLRRRFADHLTAQDAQPLRAHVTVQNKVDRQTARATLEQLRDGFEPRAVAATGLALWRYVGGPWEPVHRVAFAAP